MFDLSPWPRHSATPRPALLTLWPATGQVEGGARLQTWIRFLPAAATNRVAPSTSREGSGPGLGIKYRKRIVYDREHPRLEAAGEALWSLLEASGTGLCRPACENGFTGRDETGQGGSGTPQA